MVATVPTKIVSVEVRVCVVVTVKTRLDTMITVEAVINFGSRMKHRRNETIRDPLNMAEWMNECLQSSVQCHQCNRSTMKSSIVLYNITFCY